jgi:hypothetical protein
MAKDDDKVMQYTIAQNMKSKKQAPKDVQSESSKMQQAEEEKQRKVDQEYEAYQRGQKQEAKDNAGFREGVSKGMEDLKSGASAIGSGISSGVSKLKEMLSGDGKKNGGSVKASKMGSVKTSRPTMKSASSRGDGIAQRGKTKGRMV